LCNLYVFQQRSVALCLKICGLLNLNSIVSSN
jgi:hypothetical protein